MNSFHNITTIYIEYESHNDTSRITCDYFEPHSKLTTDTSQRQVDREIWDEHQWEEFFRESDKRTELYHQLWEAYIRDHPPPEEDAPQHLQDAYWDAMHADLAVQMGWDSDYEDDVEDLWLDIDDDALYDDLEDDELEEEWKTGLAEEFPDEQPTEELPLWQAADVFRQATFAWLETVPPPYRGTAIVEVCANVIQIVTKLGAAHRMGYEMDVLGGNIAQTKRALQAANRALTALHNLRDADFMANHDYERLYEQAYEVRNGLALRVQSLRERFEKGVE